MRLVGMFCLFILSFSSLARETLLSLYRPLTKGVNHPYVKITKEVKGTCLNQSALIFRQDAWQCQVEKKQYDPCFETQSLSPSQVVCISSPWATAGSLITTPTPLRHGEHAVLDMSRTYPWAVELSDGVKCMGINDNKVYDGAPIRYRCNDNSFLFGHLQRCATTWKILKHTEGGDGLVSIERAWF